MLRLRQRFPQALQINRAERAIIKSITRPPGFAPNHPAMIGPQWTAKTGVAIGFHHLQHIHAAISRRMRAFVKFLCAGDFDIAAMREMNAARWAESANHFRQIIFRRHTERAGAKRQTVRRMIDQIEHALQSRFVRNDARQAKDRPRRIIGMQRQLG